MFKVQPVNTLQHVIDKQKQQNCANDAILEVYLQRFPHTKNNDVPLGKRIVYFPKGMT